MLSNFDIEDYAKTEDYNLIGVFSKDMIPDKKRVGSYVINMQDHDDGQGTHWVAFIIFENAKCCYFDSYGVHAPKDILYFLKIFKPIGTNKRQIQYINSVKCGYFCLAFIKWFNNVDPKKEDVYELYDDFINAFSSNLKLNDKIVMELLNKN
jgi:hypothetical protein